MVVKDNTLLLSVNTDMVKKWGFSQAAVDKNCSEYRSGLTDNYANVKGIDFINDPKRTVTLVDYDSIPEATRQSKGMPTKAELIKHIQNQQLASLVAFSQHAYNYYLAHPATAKRAKEKAEQASWLLAIAGAKGTHWKPLGFTKVEDFYLKAIDLMNQQATAREWHAWKCSTLKGLIKKLTPFKKALKVGKTGSQEVALLHKAFDSLISKKTGNDNPEKLNNEQKALLVQLYADGNVKLNFEQVWHIYTRKAQEMIELEYWADKVKNTDEYKCLIAPSTVRAFLTKPAIKQLWFEARHGYQEYRNVFEPITKRINATYANAVWVIDGTPIHRYFRKLTEGKKQGNYFKWNIYIILDAHSHCVLGFWLSESEDAESVCGALRSACMVSGYMPHLIYSDHGSANQSFIAQQAMDAISVVNFAAGVGNARTKVVEGYFHWFNENVEKFRSGFTHNPFAKRLDNRPNREALARMVKSDELALMEQGIQDVITDLTIANHTPRPFLGGKSAIETYRASIEASKAKQREFTDLIDVEAFWTRPGKQVKTTTYIDSQKKTVSTFEYQDYEFTNKGIEITINGKQRFYTIEDEDFRRFHTTQRFQVRYEPNPTNWSDGQRPDCLLLYVQGKPVQWQGMHMALLPTKEFHMAPADWLPNEAAQLREHLDRKKKQRAAVQQDFSKLIESTKANGTHVNLITEQAYDKEVLTNAQAFVKNQIIQGDDFSISEVHSEAPRKKVDRLSLGMEDDPLFNNQ